MSTDATKPAKLDLKSLTKEERKELRGNILKAIKTAMTRKEPGITTAELCAKFNLDYREVYIPLRGRKDVETGKSSDGKVIWLAVDPANIPVRKSKKDAATDDSTAAAAKPTANKKGKKKAKAKAKGKAKKKASKDEAPEAPVAEAPAGDDAAAEEASQEQAAE